MIKFRNSPFLMAKWGSGAGGIEYEIVVRELSSNISHDGCRQNVENCPFPNKHNSNNHALLPRINSSPLFEIFIHY